MPWIQAPPIPTLAAASANWAAAALVADGGGRFAYATGGGGVRVVHRPPEGVPLMAPLPGTPAAVATPPSTSALTTMTAAARGTPRGQPPSDELLAFGAGGWEPPDVPTPPSATTPTRRWRSRLGAPPVTDVGWWVGATGRHPRPLLVVATGAMPPRAGGSGGGEDVQVWNVCRGSGSRVFRMSLAAAAAAVAAEEAATGGGGSSGGGSSGGGGGGGGRVEDAGGTPGGGSGGGGGGGGCGGGGGGVVCGRDSIGGGNNGGSGGTFPTPPAPPLFARGIATASTGPGGPLLFVGTSSGTVHGVAVGEDGTFGRVLSLSHLAGLPVTALAGAGELLAGADEGGRLVVWRITRVVGGRDGGGTDVPAMGRAGSEGGAAREGAPLRGGSTEARAARVAAALGTYVVRLLYAVSVAVGGGDAGGPWGFVHGAGAGVGAVAAATTGRTGGIGGGAAGTGGTGGRDDAVTAVALTPDGLLLAGTTGGMLTFHAVRTRVVVATVAVAAAAVTAIALDNGGVGGGGRQRALAAIAAEDGRVSVLGGGSSYTPVLTEAPAGVGGGWGLPFAMEGGGDDSSCGLVAPSQRSEGAAAIQVGGDNGSLDGSGGGGGGGGDFGSWSGSCNGAGSGGGGGTGTVTPPTVTVKPVVHFSVALRAPVLGVTLGPAPACIGGGGGGGGGGCAPELTLLASGVRGLPRFRYVRGSGRPWRGRRPDATTPWRRRDASGSSGGGRGERIGGGAGDEAGGGGAEVGGGTDWAPAADACVDAVTGDWVGDAGLG
ncbi:hypothetical protein MMPV_006763 [Pyropia vietnamensis]